jgi:Divergent InlB B-repeat domain
VSRIVAALSLAAFLASVAVAATGAGAQQAAASVRSSSAAAFDAPSGFVARGAETTWCGTAAESDRTPNEIGGNPVHWIYLIPSDGADQLSSVANAMQSDAEQIDSWWRGQDPSRTPRNDLASFSCGAQLDITTLRSERSSSQLFSLGGRFAGIADSLERAGFASTFTKYLVYYDGPVDDDNVCGQGGSDSSGLGVAVVYYRSCVGVSTAAVAAHEFLHTIGAVPSGAPHECTGDANGHTCDDKADLMYPAIGAGPLSVKVLDPGRDDYYGHGGEWLDTQDSEWLVRLDSQAPLAVSVSGRGSVAADVPGLECAASCTTTWNSGQQLALIATPATGARLVRWGGACSGAAGCSLTVEPGAAVSALFAPAAFRLTVTVAGQGAVRSSRAGISCRPRCSAAYPSYSPVRLTAKPAKGWRFRSWSGACRGSKKVCRVPMTAATKARATFIRV